MDGISLAPTRRVVADRGSQTAGDVTLRTGSLTARDVVWRYATSRKFA